jgi:hypothetical protein
MRYRKKPEFVEAEQLTPEACWRYWLERKPILGSLIVSGNYHAGNRIIYNASVYLPSESEDVNVAILGDWIVKDENGQFEKLTSAEFEATYEQTA